LWLGLIALSTAVATQPLYEKGVMPTTQHRRTE
jgi:hypothetical protein